MWIFPLSRGKSTGLSGNRDAAKSLFARSLVRLEAPARIVSGTILIDGTDVADKGPQRLWAFPGKKDLPGAPESSLCHGPGVYHGKPIQGRPFHSAGTGTVHGTGYTSCWKRWGSLPLPSGAASTRTNGAGACSSGPNWSWRFCQIRRA